jgi:2-iminobutanoate/2-iminopropanoate deaminase
METPLTRHPAHNWTSIPNPHEREQEQMSHIYITSGEGVPPGDWPFSAAVVAGNLCFVSGQPALDPATGEYKPGTIEEEFNQAFSNVRSVAKAAGFSLDELVSVHVALADIADYEAVNRVYREAFADVAGLPARLTYQAGALPLGCKVEVQAIAAHP